MRTELKEIDPPKDVQETMNKVVKAENEKIAAIDFATATETMADGARRAEIKKAEGIRQAKILEAEGEAQAIALVNEAADRYFVGNAQLLKRLEVVEKALATNAKIVVPAGHPAGQRDRGDGGGAAPAAARGKIVASGFRAELEHEARACLALDLQHGLQLLGEQLHQQQAHGARGGRVAIRRQPHPVVPHLQAQPLRAGAFQDDADQAPAARGEGVLQGVGNQLADQQAQQDRAVSRPSTSSSSIEISRRTMEALAP